LTTAFASGGQQPINSGGAGLQNSLANFGRKRKVPVAFHRLQQHRDRRLQPLATNTVGGFPEDRQSLNHCLVV
jgi:hypothetical protein